MKTISLEYVSYVLQVRNIKDKASTINPEISEQMEEGLNSGILLKKYIEKLAEIKELFVLYKSLTEKDTDDFIKTGDTVRRTDEALAGR